MRTGGKRAGRYPKGYGLPSLVIVLFLVSVLVSEIANAISRETVEARAAAAMSGVEERLHAFEVTGGDGAALLPHLTPSRNVTVTVTADASGSGATARVEPSFLPGPEAALFDQRLRAFLNVPATAPIGPLRPGDVRRKHPERVLRSGDRMGAPLDMTGDPAAPASVLGAGETRSGTGLATRSAAAGALIGLEGSLLTAPELTALRLVGNAAEISGDATATAGSVAGAAVSAEVVSGSLQVTGLLKGRDALAPDTRVSGSFATDSLDEQDRIYFDRVTASGVRTPLGRANLLRFGEVSGPAPGQLQGGVAPVDPDQIFSERP